jgi:hypothetical protein
MKHFDTTLKQYAKSGYRSAQEWASLGRVVVIGASARVDASCRGKPVSLYTADQTEMRRAGAEGERPTQAVDVLLIH